MVDMKPFSNWHHLFLFVKFFFRFFFLFFLFKKNECQLRQQWPEFRKIQSHNCGSGSPFFWKFAFAIDNNAAWIKPSILSVVVVVPLVSKTIGTFLKGINLQNIRQTTCNMSKKSQHTCLQLVTSQCRVTGKFFAVKIVFRIRQNKRNYEKLSLTSTAARPPYDARMFVYR